MSHPSSFTFDPRSGRAVHDAALDVIAKLDLGVDRDQVGKQIRDLVGDRLGLTPAQKGAIVRVGNPNPGRAAYGRARSSLTWDDVRTIRAEVDGGAKLEALAIRFGITFASVGDIARNEMWHDPDYTPGHRELVCAEPTCGRAFRVRRSNARYCSPRCRHRHYQRTRGGYYERREQEAAPAVARGTVWRLDGPVGEGATLMDVETTDPGDVVEQVANERLREILADVEMEDVARMSDDELVQLRATLAREGFAPSVAR